MTNRCLHRSTGCTLLLAVLLISLTGCRSLILENRRDCPAWVSLKACPEVDGDNWAYLQLWLFRDGGQAEEGLWVRADQLNEGISLAWKKGTDCQVSGLSGWTGKTGQDGQLLIPEGSPCPDALGAYLKEGLDADDSYMFSFEVKSLSANVLFDITGSGTEGIIPVLRGQVDGYDFPALSLHEGSFRCPAEALSKGIFSVRIPRQEQGPETRSFSSALVLDLFRQGEEAPFYSFPLGKLLLDKDYDWTSPQLEEIRVGLLFEGGILHQFSVQAGAWKVIVIENGEDRSDQPPSAISFVLAEPDPLCRSTVSEGLSSMLPLQVQCRPIDGDIATKTAQTTSLTEFYASATTGSAGSETAVWTSARFSGSSLFTGGKYWPDANPSYHFYAANAPLTYRPEGATIAAVNSTDLVCAYLPNAAYQLPNALTFNHIFSRIGTVTVMADSGVTLQDVELWITPHTGGTYHLRTGIWNNVQTGEPVSLAPNSEGLQENSLLLVPGQYTLTASWQATRNGRTATYDALTTEVDLEAGIDYALTLTLGTGLDFYLLPGVFSVSESEHVRFGMGNLCATLADGPYPSRYSYPATWSFFPHQYGYDSTCNTTFEEGSLVDRFCWVGESASYYSYGLFKYSQSFASYMNAGYVGDQAGEALKSDWGENPDLVRDMGSGFFTLSLDQWNYLLRSRPNAIDRLGTCTITDADGNDIYGLLILPDNWVRPTNCHCFANVRPNSGLLEIRTLSGQNNAYDDRLASGESNAWCDMEAAGAVFLPIFNTWRYHDRVVTGNTCRYWAPDPAPAAGTALGLEIGSALIYVGNTGESRLYTHPVRLVAACD